MIIRKINARKCSISDNINNINPAISELIADNKMIANNSLNGTRAQMEILRVLHITLICR